MSTTKKFLSLALCACLVACSHAPTNKNIASPNTHIKKIDSPQPTPSQVPIISDAEFSACVNSLSEKAKVAGISKATIDVSLAKAKLNKRVIELDRKQPEFSTTFSDYFNRGVSEQRITQGQALLIKHKELLDKVTQQYGVPAPYILAFWGLETNFGSTFGNIPVIDSLTTLACDARRSNFFTGELISALRILDEGAIAPDKMIGSWAGAMGNFQFMPSAFLQNAIDYDGDKKRDLWNSTPDAIASAGKFLKSLGWQADGRWGREVKLPNNFSFLEAGLKNTKTIDEWKKLGVKCADGKPLPSGKLQASLLVPSGAQGPVFLVYDNFNVIMRWNRSEFYSLAVGHLADRIAGGEKLIQPLLLNEPRLRLDQIKTLQAQLNQRGFDTGTPDGILGPGTRKAISQFQHKQGMIADGFPNKETLGLLGISIDPVKN